MAVGEIGGESGECCDGGGRCCGRWCRMLHCEKLKWLCDVKKHINWTAASSTSVPERTAKWSSILNHVQDIHTHKTRFLPVSASNPHFYRQEQVVDSRTKNSKSPLRKQSPMLGFKDRGLNCIPAVLQKVFNQKSRETLTTS
ncbi:hypothetical protein JOB18_002716 [Solea senegalensis]|uniref:Uncharacterized protein n=1 Tax=Solea senegalensis TaxID=28829 RepID=A0AAV6PMF5_SOLSE|nr:hypothetical protein JOB18_002716 [Solea senegalensis]